jgi:hypothetical protein
MTPFGLSSCRLPVAVLGEFTSTLQLFQFAEHVRLDLTAGSRAYLLEPHWNPMIEEQALCRVHRVGQQREVTTVRYLMRGSFEEVSSLSYDTVTTSIKATRN